MCSIQQDIFTVGYSSRNFSGYYKSSRSVRFVSKVSSKTPKKETFAYKRNPTGTPQESPYLPFCSGFLFEPNSNFLIVSIYMMMNCYNEFESILDSAYVKFASSARLKYLNVLCFTTTNLMVTIKNEGVVMVLTMLIEPFYAVYTYFFDNYNRFMK